MPGLALLLGAVALGAQAQDKFVVGQSAPLSGGNAKFGTDIRDGAKAYFAAVNAKGGVNGGQIELITIDDKNDRKNAVQTPRLCWKPKIWWRCLASHQPP